MSVFNNPRWCQKCLKISLRTYQKSTRIAVEKNEKDFVQRLIETSKDSEMSDNAGEQERNPPSVNADNHK